MAWVSSNGRPRTEVSGRAGLLLGAFANGISFQPNLLPRGSRGQAVISGISAAAAFGWGSTAHSLLRSAANRIPGATDGSAARAASGAVVDAAVAVGGAALARSLPTRSGEPAVRALVRLGAAGFAAAALAGLGADALEARRGRAQAVGGALAALTAWGAGYGIARRGRGGTNWMPRRKGSPIPVGEHVTPEDLVELDLTIPMDARERIDETPDQVVVPAAAAAGIAVTGVLLGLSWVESRMSGLAAAGAARAIGGDADDHRLLGRAIVWAGAAGATWWLFTRVNAALEEAGVGSDPAHAERPARPEVTSGPGSPIDWAVHSRESRRWLTMALSPEAIERVMGEPARAPIRLYVPRDAADTPAERADLLLSEIDRTGALTRPVFVLFSPTGSGYVNYVATETLEYLTRGNCASAAVQYSVLPSALSLTSVGAGAEQTRAVVNGVVARLLAVPRAERPAFYLFGESLGAHVGQEIFVGQGIGGPAGIGARGAIWLGTPAPSRWREQLLESRPSDSPGIGPGSAFLARAASDWVSLSGTERRAIQYLFLDNGNDPVPKFDAPLLWRPPAWLGPDARRPPGAPRGTHWLPVTTFFTTFLDLQNALRPNPGRFHEGGHDYRRLLPDVVRTVYDLPATREQMTRVQAALRERELAWAVRRGYTAAGRLPAGERSTALARLTRRVADWTGLPVGDVDVRVLAAELS